MVGSCVKCTIILAVCVAGLGYWLIWTGPLPEDIDRPQLIQSFAAIKKIMQLFQVEWIGRTFFGHTNKYQCARAMINVVATTPALDSDPDLEVKDIVLGSIPARMYRPKTAPVPSPALMHFHGGGWSVGSINDFDLQSRYIAKEAHTVVLAVTYRLAPEHPFPAGLDDCVAATLHVLTNGRDLGIDVKRVGVGGYSAGGNVAAAVSLRLQDEEFHHLPKLRYQLLVAPCLQGIDSRLPSSTMEAYTRWLLSREDMASFYSSYAGLDLSPDSVREVMQNQHIRPETRERFTQYISPELVKEELEKTAKTKVPLAVPTPEEDKITETSVNYTLAALAEPVFLNPFFSPLLAEDYLLKGLPQALVAMGQYDVLRDDALLYARRLRSAQVPVMSVLVETGHHFTFCIMTPEPGSDVAKDAYEKITDFIKKANS